MASSGASSCGTNKLFKLIQKSGEYIGIYPLKSNRNHSPINWRNWLILVFCHAEFFISTAAHLLFEENSMIEYGMISYACTAGLFTGIVYLLLIWQMKNILNFIQSSERFIRKSE